MDWLVLRAIGERLRDVFSTDRLPLPWKIIDPIEKLAEAEEATAQDNEDPAPTLESPNNS